MDPPRVADACERISRVEHVGAKWKLHFGCRADRADPLAFEVAQRSICIHSRGTEHPLSLILPQRRSTDDDGEGITVLLERTLGCFKRSRCLPSQAHF
jgi:hypothetical protein